VRLLEAQLAASVEMYQSASKEHQAGLGRSMKENVTNLQVARRLEPLREAVHQKEAALRMAELDVEEATLRARVEGTVSLILHHEGDVVPAATEIVRVTSARPGVVVCWLPEKVAEQIAVGRVVELRRTGLLEKRFMGKVEDLAPEIEEVPIRARVSPAVPAWGRRAVITSAPDRPLLPGEALRLHFRGRGGTTLAALWSSDAAAAVPPRSDQNSAGTSVSAIADAGAASATLPRPARAAGPDRTGAAPAPIKVPPALASRSATLEPSGIAWAAALDRYLIVSDNTNPADDHHQP